MALSNYTLYIHYINILFIRNIYNLNIDICSEVFYLMYEKSRTETIPVHAQLGSLTLTNRKSIRKAREGLFFLSNLSVIFCVT